ncbi:MAG TPA: hypothetical protein VMW42_03645 [Desulfatiglandales bacterium]|nr:hypothetical protein [Desulfatiglandales bacterium]
MDKKPGIQTLYIDRPEISETFADFVHSLHFDGQTMRIEFCTTRFDKPKPPDPPTAKQYPICRLVLTPPAAIDLFNKLQQIMSVLEKSGAVKRASITPKTVQ